jgi:hypothetical protein
VFSNANPLARSALAARYVANHCLKAGLQSPFLGRVPASDIFRFAPDENFREHLMARVFHDPALPPHRAALNSRQRALLDLFHEEFGHVEPWALKIYMHEAMTPFALCLRGRFPFALGSEYAPDPETRMKIFPVPAVDAAATQFQSDVFDVVFSADVFEHVPDLRAALAETARILKPGGTLYATLPLAYDQRETITKARLEENGIKYLTEPEYHGNPVDPEGGALVFQIPGWDVLDLARDVGFSYGAFDYLVSSSRGIAGCAGQSGVMVLIARK